MYSRCARSRFNQTFKLIAALASLVAGRSSSGGMAPQGKIDYASDGGSWNEQTLLNTVKMP
jgi:hypothetical protein